MIGSLFNFLNFLNVSVEETKVKPNEQEINEKDKNKMNTVELENEEENIFKEEKKIITKVINGKEVKIELTSQSIPISKTQAIKKTYTQRIQ
ncbi:hypothetical protein [Campylobacter troglodytis]|uniref:hypothetical protein n=1 Tax=Campylobacter troglodytis TaxID=654363 RepID=UPI0011574A56|nr:hypothetical protein [Campylobacter troglodytis]TQR53185.1 hypothetical protein DMC01_11740 [Campylobacter troglodytis]